MYFEAHSFAKGFVSFTTSGFFDQEGYEEPQRTKAEIAIENLNWLWWLMGLSAIAFIFTIYCCCFRGSKNKSRRMKIS
jgi:uncharacterized membrane protein YdcZ (DUF606 family)